MANPKNRNSRTRRDLRRTHWKLQLKSLSRCSQCHEPKRSHQVCPSCGYYNGRQVMEVKTK